VRVEGGGTAGRDEGERGDGDGDRGGDEDGDEGEGEDEGEDEDEDEEEDGDEGEGGDEGEDEGGDEGEDEGEDEDIRPSVAAGASGGRVGFRGFAPIPRRLRWRSMMRSRPTSRISWSLAPGCEWESASRAAASFSRSCFGAVRWMRRRSEVRGSTSARREGRAGTGTEVRGAPADAAAVGTATGTAAGTATGTAAGSASEAASDAARADVAVVAAAGTGTRTGAAGGTGVRAEAEAEAQAPTDSPSVTESWHASTSSRRSAPRVKSAASTADAVAACETRSVVTSVRSGGAGAGRSSATTSFASRFEVPKNRGTTSARLSGVMTFESSTTLERFSRPSRRGSARSGYRWSSSAAVFR
jgi:hypothetical protein